MSTDYDVVGYLDGCPTYTSRTKLKVISNPLPNLGKDAFICPDELNFNVRLNPGSFNSYKWQDESSLPFLRLLMQENLKSRFGTTLDVQVLILCY